MDISEYISYKLGKIQSSLLPSFKNLMGEVLSGCRVNKYGSKIEVICPSQSVAALVKENYLKVIAQVPSDLMLPPFVTIKWPGGFREIPTWKVNSSLNGGRSMEPLSSLGYGDTTDVVTSSYESKIAGSTIEIAQLTDFTGREDIDSELAQLAYSEKQLPIWIVDQSSLIGTVSKQSSDLLGSSASLSLPMRNLQERFWLKIFQSFGKKMRYVTLLT